jgi:diaminopimelate decarboxylase
VAADNVRYLNDDPDMRKWEWLGKFGMDVDDVLDAAEIAHAHGGIELAGLHSHIGFTAYRMAYSRDLDLLRHRRQVEEVIDVAVALKERGVGVRVLNLGGGYRVGRPEGYGPGKLTDFPTADDYAATIGGRVRDLCAEHDLGQPELLLEAGGYLVADAVALLGTVGFRKERRGDAGARRWVYLENTSGYHFVRRLMYGFYHRVVAASRMNDPAETATCIAGPICADDDVAMDELLPPLERGDLVAVLDNGAYCESVTSDYCAVPIPGAVLVRDGRAELVRRRETVDDIAGRFAVPAWLSA